MFEKEEYQLLVQKLKSSKFTKEDYIFLLQLQKLTQDLKLAEKLGTLIFLFSKDGRQEFSSEEQWKNTLKRRKDELLSYARGMIETTTPIWEFLAAQRGWNPPQVEDKKE